MNFLVHDNYVTHILAKILENFRGGGKPIQNRGKQKNSGAELNLKVRLGSPTS